MSVAMYKLSVPVFIRGLTILSNLLEKAEAHAAAGGPAVETLFAARLAPDMLTLAGQVQRVSDTSKNTIGRLTAEAPPSFPDDETTFAQLKERVTKTIAFLETVKEADLEGSETRTVTMKFGKLEFSFTGDDYVLKFALPNFYFHLTTAYDILRAQGVPVGKADYIGAHL